LLTGVLLIQKRLFSWLLVTIGILTSIDSLLLDEPLFVVSIQGDTRLEFSTGKHYFVISLGYSKMLKT
jgi:hypothetical protein